MTEKLWPDGPPTEEEVADMKAEELPDDVDLPWDAEVTDPAPDPTFDNGLEIEEELCYCGDPVSAKIHDVQSDHFEHTVVDQNFKPAGSEPEAEAETVETTAVVGQSFSLGDMMQIASIALASGNYPDLYNHETAMVRILAGRELGLQPMVSLRNLFVIEGKVTMAAGLIGSQIKHSLKYDYRFSTHTTTECVLKFYENGEEIGASSFTMDDAKTAKLVKPNSGWEKYPKAMLFARALTQGARWFCPDAFDGAIYTPDELTPLAMNSGSMASGSPADTTQTVQVGVPAASGAVKPVRTPYAPTGDETYKAELCPSHYNHPESMKASRGAVTFFKAGRMRGYAHATGPKGSGAPWCNWDEVHDDFKAEAVDVLTEAGYDQIGMKAAVEKAFPDLENVVLTKYRIADWAAIVEYDWEGEKDA